MPLPALAVLLALSATLAGASPRNSQQFNDHWHFHLGDLPAASTADFDHSAWRQLDLPHDWAFEAGVSETGTQRDAGGYYSGGIGWYRKSFDLPALEKDQRAILEFDGVYMNSEVWLNGHPLGKFPYGYLTFSHDLTAHLKPGQNTIAVRCDNSQEPSARWYHPCGIYAPVRLVIRNKIGIENIFITTVDLKPGRATLNIAVLLNEPKGRRTSVLYRVIPPGGESFLEPSTIRGSIPSNGEITISDPQLWSPDTPHLYTLVTTLYRDGLRDEVHTTFGIRTIDWKPDTGFWLNGENIKLKGVCEHWEGGPVGGAWTPDLMRWKLQTLKSMGCNAIRTAHNPCPPFFYDLCDELGILVMDEIFDGWGKKAPHDYGAQAFAEHWKADLTSWIKRDRNHPSIVIWSLGNETRGEVAKDLVALCHQLDPTRPVTSGHSGSEHMDVYGVNGTAEKQSFYTDYPRPKNKAFIATEAPHTWQVRGYYRTRTWFRDGYPNKRQDPFPCPDLTPTEIFTYDWTAPANKSNQKQIFNSSYDNAMVRITARKNWELMRDLPWYAGHFRWTGFDYPGEAGYVHGGWPFRAFMGGTHDLAGFPKDLASFYQSQWTDEAMVHLLPHWTHPLMKPGTEIPVVAYSNAREVELFLDSASLGIRIPGRTAETMQCEWLVPWKPGKLTAIARRDGQDVASTTIRTAGPPAALQLTVETVGQAAILTTTLTDANGNHTPYADNRIHYHLEGDAKLLAHENGNPVDTGNGVTSPSRRAFMGLTRSFYQTHGPASLTAFAILGSRNGINRESGFATRPHQARVTIHRAASHLSAPSLAPSHPDTIHYTTDGTDPTPDSPLFDKPFPVTLPTTVKALVLRDGKPLLTMEELFATDQGLYWPTGNEAATPDQGAGMQAESAKLSAGAKISTAGKAFHGSGFVDLPKPDSQILWYQENDGSAGEFLLTFRYANGDPKGIRRATLLVNGRKIDTLTFPNTGSWGEDWKTLRTKVQLKAGANEISLRATRTAGPTIDELLVE